MLYMARPRRPEDFEIGHLDLLQPGFDFPFPETQKFTQFWKLWGEVQHLPDLGLQQVEVIGRAVYDFGGGKAVTT